MKAQDLRATGLVARSSLPYIQNLFRLNTARKPFVNVLREGSPSANPGIVIDEVLTCG